MFQFPCRNRRRKPTFVLCTRHSRNSRPIITKDSCPKVQSAASTHFLPTCNNVVISCASKFWPETWQSAAPAGSSTYHQFSSRTKLSSARSSTALAQAWFSWARFRPTVKAVFVMLISAKSSPQYSRARWYIGGKSTWRTRDVNTWARDKLWRG